MKKEIVGKWIEKNGEIVGDSNCLLIEEMLLNDLKFIESTNSGWTRCFEDKDGKIWELNYPHGSYHGGGPPKLSQIEE